MSLIDGITEPPAQQEWLSEIGGDFSTPCSKYEYCSLKRLQPKKKRNLIECHLGIMKKYINDPLGSPCPISCCCGECMHRPSPFSGPFPVADFGPSFPRATSHCSPAYSYDRFSSEIHSGFSSAEPIFTELIFFFRKSPLVAFPLLLQLPVEHPLRLTLMGFLWLSFLHRETEPLETGSCD